MKIVRIAAIRQTVYPEHTCDVKIGAAYALEYKFRDVYLLTTAADDDEHTPKRAENGLGGWIECFPESRLAGTLFCGGVNAPGEIEGNVKLQEAFEMGRQV